MTTTQGEINPMELGAVKEVLTDMTFDKYKQTWVEFIGASGISVGREPEQKDFLDFFAEKRSKGLSGNYLKSLHSHLSKFYSILYSRNLSVSSIKN